MNEQNDAVMTDLPIGITPRKDHDNKRALEIIDACERYVRANKNVPYAWLSELQDLIT